MSELVIPKERRHSKRRTDTVGNYILGKTLGKGTTGKVRVGYHKDTQMEVAVKIVKKDNVQSHKQKILREIAVMRLLEHPHIMKLYDVIESKNHYFMVLEWVKGGELFDYIVQKGKLPRKEALRILSQCVQALEYCHRHSICHRDLKPENLLLDENLNIKIADFGYANIIPDGSVLKTFCGSPHYGAPEVVSGIKYDGRHSDVWSLGVVFYALVTGMLPFDHPQIPDLLRLVKKAHYTIPGWVDPDIKDLIRRMLCPDISKRIRTDQIKHHPVFYGKNKINLYFPTNVAPSPALEYMRNNPIQSPDEIDQTIIKDMEGLGWGSSEQITESLLSKRTVTLHNLEYVFYCMLAARNEVRLKEKRKIECAVDDAENVEHQLLTLGLNDNSPKNSPKNSPDNVNNRSPPSPNRRVRRDNDDSAKRDKKPRKALQISVTKGSQEHMDRKGAAGANQQPNSAEDGRKKEYCTTPRFHRLKFDRNAPPSPKTPVTPSAKTSWFKTLFRRRPSLDIASKQHQQKGASGLYSSAKPMEIRTQVEGLLRSMGVQMKIGSHSDYELKCEAQCNVDEGMHLIIYDQDDKVVYEGKDDDRDGAAKPQAVLPPMNLKEYTDPNKKQTIKFTVDISREPNDKVSCLNFNQRSGNLLLYRALYTDIIKQLDIE